MNMKQTTKSLNLPKQIAAYFTADKGDSETLSQCFTENAVVRDEGHTYKGRAAIKEWKTDASAKYENTHASLSPAKRRTGRRSSPAIWLEIFPAVPLTFDSFSNSKGTRLRRWKSSHRRWSARLVGCVERRGGLRFNHLLPGNQHDSEASFVSHHAGVSFGSPESVRGQRNGFDHRTELFQGAKGKRVLGIYRRAGHRSR